MVAKQPQSPACLAAKIAGFEPAQLGKAGLARARADLISVIAGGLAGRDAPLVRSLRRAVESAPPGNATVLGSALKLPALDAAFANAMAASLGRAGDDAFAAPIAVVALAVAEAREMSGAALIAAYLAGREAALRLASDGVGMARVAAVGCAVAYTRLAALPADRLAMALSLLDEGGDGLEALAAGTAARQGLLAAMLAEAGEEGVQGEASITEPMPGFGGDAAGAEDWNASPFSISAPVPAGDLWDVFEEQARRSLPRDQIAPLFERLETLDKLGELSAATRLLSVSPINNAPPRKVVFAARGTHEPEETTWVP